MDVVRKIADAVLYEGYILWPYRRSATKNQRRWTFGGAYPPSHSRGHPDDPAELRTEVTADAAPGAQVRATVRFLHVVERRIARGSGSDRVFVDELAVAGERHLAWDEAVEREVEASATFGEEPQAVPIAVGEGTAEEPLGDEGAIVRTWQPLAGSLELSTNEVSPRRFRLTARIRNDTRWEGGDRQHVLRRTFCSTHVVLHADGAAFLSSTDPASADCENAGLWPVLVGDPGARETMLAAPIILGDYPEIAPESPGDLFDATEIDKLLILNVLALTPEEQAEMRASDPRAREILDRCAGLSQEQLMRLRGAIREFRPAGVE